MKSFEFFGGALKIHPFFIVCVVICVLLGNIFGVLVFMGALLLHEICHGITARALRAQVCAMELMPFGCAMEIEYFGCIERSKQILIAAAGPLGNITAAALLYMLPFCEKGVAAEYFINANIYLCCINLLPVLPLDGGRILFALVSEKKRGKAVEILGILGAILGGGMTALGIYIIYKGYFNLTMLIMGIFIFGGGITKAVSKGYVFCRDTGEKMRALRSKKAVGVNSIAVYKNMTAGEVIKLLDRSRINVICVVDECGECIGSIYENKLLWAMAKYGNTVPLCKLTENKKSDKII